MRDCSVPYLRVANVQRGYLDLEHIKEIEIPEDELEKFTVFEGDLLITEGGDWDKVGRTAIWQGDIPLAIHQNHVFKARCILPEQNAYWLEKYLNSEEARKYFAKSSKQTTNLASIKNTLPMFFGLIVITLFVLFLAYSIQQDNIKEAAYLEQPAINDLYIADFTKVFDDTDPDYSYGAMRVKQISSNQVELQVSKIAYNKVSGVRKDIREKKSLSDAYYDGESLYIDISKLKEMKESGAIYSIERI